MHTAVRPHLTTGVALIGASAIAVAPLVIPAPALTKAEHAVAQAISRDVNLMVDGTTLDLGATFNGTLNGVLGGIAVSLGLETNPVDAEASFTANLSALSAAVLAQLQADFAANPLNGLLDLITLPVGIITGAATGFLANLPDIGDLTGLLAGLPGLGDLTGLLTGLIDNLPDLGGLTGLLTLPITLITNLVANLPGLGDLTGLLDNLPDLGGLTGLLTLPITLLTNLLGGINGGVEGGVTGNVMLGFGAAFQDVIDGLVAAGKAGLDGLAAGLGQGATALTTLVGSTVQALTTALQSGVGAFGTAIGGGVLAGKAILDALADAAAHINAGLTGTIGGNVEIGTGNTPNGFASTALTGPAELASIGTTSLGTKSVTLDVTPPVADTPQQPVVDQLPGNAAPKAGDVVSAIETAPPSPARGKAVATAAANANASVGQQTAESGSANGSAHANAKASDKVGKGSGGGSANASVKAGK